MSAVYLFIYLFTVQKYFPFFFLFSRLRIKNEIFWSTRWAWKVYYYFLFFKWKMFLFKFELLFSPKRREDDGSTRKIIIYNETLRNKMFFCSALIVAVLMIAVARFQSVLFRLYLVPSFTYYSPQFLRCRLCCFFYSGKVIANGFNTFVIRSQPLDQGKKLIIICS